MTKVSGLLEAPTLMTKYINMVKIDKAGKPNEYYEVSGKPVTEEQFNQELRVGYYNG